MAILFPEEFKTKSGRLVTVRHCEMEDIDAFLVFQPKIASETTNTLQVEGRVPEASAIRRNWESTTKDSISLRIGAFVDGRMIAQLSFRQEHPPHPWTAHIGSFGMGILQEYWGEGIGRRMLEIMENFAQVNGIAKIEAHVRAGNDRGVRLYTRMGYEIEGTRKKAAMIKGLAQDEFYIAKFLNEIPSWKPPVIETERLILRPLELKDATNIFDYAKNPNVSRYTLWEPHATLKDSEAFILDYAFSKYKSQTPDPLAITLKSHPMKVIGTVGCFWSSQVSKSMELAYAMSEEFWGQGMATEAAKDVVDYVFREFDLIRVQARCKAENRASARVMEKIGMKFEGTLRSAVFHRERYWDVSYYSVLRDKGLPNTGDF